jgi:hypothetical protein
LEKLQIAWDQVFWVEKYGETSRARSASLQYASPESVGNNKIRIYINLRAETVAD